MQTSNLRREEQDKLRRIEDPLRAGDQTKKEYWNFQHVYKRPVEYLAKSWTFTEYRSRVIVS